MSNSSSSLEGTISLYLARDVIEPISGDTATSARNWLAEAIGDLESVRLLIDHGNWRLAYRTAYDVMRNAAESVVTKAGWRVTSAGGHHEAVFAMANALVGEASDAFNGLRAMRARMRRGASQYVDVDRASEVTKDDAEEIYDWAEQACAAASTFVRQSPRGI